MDEANHPEGIPSNIALGAEDDGGPVISPTATGEDDRVPNIVAETTNPNTNHLSAKPQGMLLSAKTVAHLAKYTGQDEAEKDGISADASEDEESCGICLENPGKGRMVILCCCKNVVCMKDAQLVGACPFCREEPLVWDIKD